MTRYQFKWRDNRLAIPAQPLRTQFGRAAHQPSIVTIYQPDRRGRLKLVRAVLPQASVR